MVQVGGSCELGGPDGQGGQDDQPRCFALLVLFVKENVWFSWSKPSNYQEKLRCHACDGRRTDGGQRKVENSVVFW